MGERAEAPVASLGSVTSTSSRHTPPARGGSLVGCFDATPEPVTRGALIRFPPNGPSCPLFTTAPLIPVSDSSSSTVGRVLGKQLMGLSSCVMAPEVPGCLDTCT